MSVNTPPPRFFPDVDLGDAFVLGGAYFGDDAGFALDEPVVSGAPTLTAASAQSITSSGCTPRVTFTR